MPTIAPRGGRALRQTPQARYALRGGLRRSAALSASLAFLCSEKDRS